MFATILLTVACAMPDVILISVDTLRADHLGMYGYERDTSPNLDRFARDAIVFEDMLCEIPLTSPSFASMMSSQFPRMTGTTRNGLPLPQDIPTAAKVFQAAGYQTLCVQSNWTLKRKLSGLDRGFDIYEDDFHKKRWGVIKSERNADEVTRIALELLDARDPDRPLFAWFHFSDPHAPYKKHRKFRMSPKIKRHRDPAAAVTARYDSEIAYTDHYIGTLLSALPEDAYVVFVGDHGESLWEHDYLGHGRRIYHPGLRVPLLIAGPGIQPGRTSIAARGIDLAPTLLSLAGLAHPETMIGFDLLDAATPTSRVRVVETYGGAVPKLPGARALMAGKGPQLQAVIAGDWKLILDGEGAELYRLSDDPGELNDLAKMDPERVTELAALIRQWDLDTTRTLTDEAALSEDDIDALNALGYIE